MKIEIDVSVEQLQAMRDFYPHEKLLSDEDFAACVVWNLVEMAKLDPSLFDPVMF